MCNKTRTLQRQGTHTTVDTRSHAHTLTQANTTQSNKQDRQITDVPLPCGGQLLQRCRGRSTSVFGAGSSRQRRMKRQQSPQQLRLRCQRLLDARNIGDQAAHALLRNYQQAPHLMEWEEGGVRLQNLGPDVRLQTRQFRFLFQADGQDHTAGYKSRPHQQRKRGSWDTCSAAKQLQNHGVRTGCAPRN